MIPDGIRYQRSLKKSCYTKEKVRRVKLEFYVLFKHIVWDDNALKVHQCRFENLPICLCLYENNTLQISLS